MRIASTREAKTLHMHIPSMIVVGQAVGQDHMIVNEVSKFHVSVRSQWLGREQDHMPCYFTESRSTAFSVEKGTFHP